MTQLRRQAIKLKVFLFGFAFCGHRIRLPWNNHLPFSLRLIPDYSQGLVTAARNYNGPIIDVGANVGDTAIMLYSDKPRHILAIESDREQWACLVKNVRDLRAIRCLRTFVDDRENSLDTILTHFPIFMNSGFLKIDVDGADLKVLHGAREYLKRVKPMIWFEYDPQHYPPNDPMDFWSYLHSLGYKRFEFHTKENTKLATLEYPKHKKILADLCSYARQTRYFYFDVLATHRSAI